MGIIKDGVSWRAFEETSLLFVCPSDDALTPNRKQAKQALAKMKSVNAKVKSMREEFRARQAKVLAMKKNLNNLLESYAVRMVTVEETRKMLHDQLQLYKARMAELEMKRDDGPSQETDQKK